MKNNNNNLLESFWRRVWLKVDFKGYKSNNRDMLNEIYFLLCNCSSHVKHKTCMLIHSLSNLDHFSFVRLLFVVVVLFEFVLSCLPGLVCVNCQLLVLRIPALLWQVKYLCSGQICLSSAVVCIYILNLYILVQIALLN